mmetsp:Transcript_61866/g.147592  ORF Transcript_61866/g.147592 Transcript_61866/m.147592 type:complete len:140 (+) Transcript_61866:100-519(+)|eukprot:CAMPEP_0178457086 /NCGR_PEP_ID=MMETSP0689_2-20121128/46831_1 /TAXON_ID=160604 /ORGANISM="Amphidinium massartii, Strain CS-259" /LENGTH=139 /DNA_ID=CAMNT_0020083317 /DNA_START=94 /DNA_END=513 /DNA_ORIENTATION=+
MAGPIPEGYVCGCGHEFNPKEVFSQKDEDIDKHYKKTGLWGAITGAFGDKKTMYCHHMTQDKKFAVKAAGDKKFSSSDEIWEFLDKKPCIGRYSYNATSGTLKCGALEKAQHDDTNNESTSLFVKNGLESPIPAWALKK